MGHEYKDAVNRKREAEASQAHHDEQKNKALRARTGNPLEHHPLPKQKVRKSTSRGKTPAPKMNILGFGCLIIIIIVGCIALFSM